MAPSSSEWQRTSKYWDAVKTTRIKAKAKDWTVKAKNDRQGQAFEAKAKDSADYNSQQILQSSSPIYTCLWSSINIGAQSKADKEFNDVKST